jgi:hypothetical protein
MNGRYKKPAVQSARAKAKLPWLVIQFSYGGYKRNNHFKRISRHRYAERRQCYGTGFRQRGFLTAFSTIVMLLVIASCGGGGDSSSTLPPPPSPPSWGTAELIETDNAGDAYNPQIAFDASGNAIAVWNQTDGTRYNIWANYFE